MKNRNRWTSCACFGAILITMAGCSKTNDTSRNADSAPRQPYEANNTGRNAGDQNRMTPEDQGTSERDVTTTQEIRKALVDESTLSVTAKNVKVITRDGKVTLRGPVVDADERSRIEAIAVRVAGEGNVTNQLELETPKS